jgi:putative phage-type endonuclease
MFGNIDIVIPDSNKKKDENETETNNKSNEVKNTNETVSSVNEVNEINAFSTIMQKNIPLSNDERVELFQELLYFLNDSCILTMKDENYKIVLYNECLNFCCLFLEITDTVEEIVEYVVHYFIKYIMNYRHYINDSPLFELDKTFVDNQLEDLKNRYQPPQKSDDWYKYRHQLITASSAWKILDSQCSQNNYIYSKCTPLCLEKFKTVNINSPFHWGNKYEPVSVLYYENKYNTVVADYGCIKHTDYDFIGASPDGINVKRDSPKYGRMLEIKNIVNRDITGTPKKEYWIQMQLQMEVCNLDVCDFLECRFKEYEDEEAFYADGTFTETADNKEKGIMCHFYENGEHIYEYAPFGCNKETYDKWEEEIMEKHGDTWINTIYWYLQEVSCVVVKRNKYWFQEALPYFSKIWDTITHEKVHGYSHRKAKKREQKIVVNKENTNNQETCLLNDDVENEVSENNSENNSKNVIIINT